MKFVTLFLIGAAVASNTLSSVDAAIKGSSSVRTGDKKKKRKNTRFLKGDNEPKAPKFGLGEPCLTCAQQLPGYSFFGENYLDDDFWEDLEEGNLPSEDEAVFFEDFFVPGPFEFSTLGVTCYDEDSDAQDVCALITFIAEAIYESDLLRCLLMSLFTTGRDLACIEQDPDGRRLEPEAAPAAPTALDEADVIMRVSALRDWSSIEKILADFNLLDSPRFQHLVERSNRRRQLNVDIRSGDTADTITGGFLSAIDEFFASAQVELAIRNNLFFAKCFVFGENDLGLCAALFGVLKAFDASVCYYREELGCGEATCTKDLAFDVLFNTERLAIDFLLPPPADKFAADILSPCSGCLLEKSGGCSAFCSYYASLCTCELENPTLSLIESPLTFGLFL